PCIWNAIFRLATLLSLCCILCPVDLRGYFDTEISCFGEDEFFGFQRSEDDLLVLSQNCKLFWIRVYLEGTYRSLYRQSTVRLFPSGESYHLEQSSPLFRNRLVRSARLGRQPFALAHTLI